MSAGAVSASRRGPRSGTATEGGAEALAVLAAAAFLLSRPLVVGSGAAPWVLLVGYAGLVAFPAVAPPRALARLAANAGPGRAIGVTAVGVAALLLARVAAGPAVPVRAAAGGIALNVAAAVGEEAFFRGFLFSRLEAAGRSRAFGTGLAVAGSALGFGLIHVPAYGWAALPLDLGAGLLFSWQRWASSRWEAPAATHVAANLLAVIR